MRGVTWPVAMTQVRELRVKNKDLKREASRKDELLDARSTALDDLRNTLNTERDERRQLDEDVRVMRTQIRDYREKLENTAESVQAREERNREGNKVGRRAPATEGAARRAGGTARAGSRACVAAQREGACTGSARGGAWRVTRSVWPRSPHTCPHCARARRPARLVPFQRPSAAPLGRPPQPPPSAAPLRRPPQPPPSAAPSCAPLAPL